MTDITSALTPDELAQLRQLVADKRSSPLYPFVGPPEGSPAWKEELEQLRKRDERRAAAQVKAEADRKVAEREEAARQQRISRHSKRLAELDVEIAQAERAIFSAPSIELGRMAKLRAATLKAERDELRR
jgi:hypothetical protein